MTQHGAQSDGVALACAEARLRFVDVAPGNAARGIVPSHRFRIVVADVEVNVSASGPFRTVQ